MKIKIYNCEGEDYSENSIDAILSNQVLEFEGKRIEVELDDSPQVFGQARGINDVNLMFKDSNTGIPENERKYFTKASWFDKQRIKWMYKRHFLQKSSFVTNLFYPLILLIIGSLLTIIFNRVSNNSDSIEIVSYQIGEGMISDTLDLRLRNIGSRTAVLKSIDFNFIKSWEIQNDITPAFELLTPSAKYELNNFSSSLINVRDSKSKSQTKSINISHEIKPNESDRILVRVLNLDNSDIGIFTIRLNYNKNNSIESEKIVHFFTQDNLDNYPHKVNDSIISNLLIGDYRILRQDTSSTETLTQTRIKIDSKKKHIDSRINNNKSAIKDAKSYNANNTIKFERLTQIYNQ